MRRLGIVAVGIAAAVALAFAAGAFALYVLPGREEARSVTVRRYTPEEAIGIVRAALDHEGSCDTGPLPQHAHWKPRWGASFDEQSGKWLVGLFCDEDKLEGPPVDYVPLGADRWVLVEDTGQLIPLTDLARELMRP